MDRRRKEVFQPDLLDHWKFVHIVGTFISNVRWSQQKRDRSWEVSPYLASYVYRGGLLYIRKNPTDRKDELVVTGDVLYPLRIQKEKEWDQTVFSNALGYSDWTEYCAEIYKNKTEIPRRIELLSHGKRIR